MVAPKRGYRKRKGTKMPRVMRKKVVKVTPGLRRAVNSIISAKAEDKKAIFVLPTTPGVGLAVIDGPINAFGTTSLSSFAPVLPAIAQGTTSSTRIGDRITVKSCYIDIIIAPNGLVSSSEDQMVRVMLVSQRDINSYYEAVNSPNPSNVDYSSLLDVGGGSSQQFVGLPRDLLVDVNRSQFVCHYDKTFHLQKPFGNNNNTTLPGQQNCLNRNTHIKLRIKVPVPKVLKYNQFADTYPSNAAPLLCIGTAHVDDTTGPATFTTGYTAVTHLRYEDI